MTGIGTSPADNEMVLSIIISLDFSCLMSSFLKARKCYLQILVIIGEWVNILVFFSSKVKMTGR